VGQRDPIADFYHALDLFVQSSELEGLPNVILEAMAFEVPVVATGAGGTSDLVRDGSTGWLVPTNDVDGLAGAMREALNDPVARRSRATAARRLVEAEFSFRVRCARLDDFYDDLLRRGRRRGLVSARGTAPC
jgi:glycosyltransferase involved in cell wall biosynthesis